MLNFEHSKDQTNDSIFNNLDDEAVYLKLLGYYPSTREKYNSPFAVDLKPSFTFYMKDRLRWKDFSSGKGGNCVDLVMEMMNLSFSEACSFIKKNCPTNPNIQKTSREPSKPAKIEVVLFDKDPESFYEYWESFCVSRGTLELYNIRAAKEVWLNDKLYSVYTDKSPVIRYLINGEYKIYAPFNSKAKWISNCKLVDIQGWKQLPETGDLLIISKAMKDVMLLREMGYNALALSSETCILPGKLVENIRGRFKTIISFLDNDGPGLATMNKYYDQYQIPFVHMPLNTECKDLSDFAYLYGLEESMKILEQLGL